MGKMRGKISAWVTISSEANMPAPTGNKYWLARSSHGRRPIFNTDDDLWDACCEYFQWVEDNPLVEAKPMAFQGESWDHEVHKMRPATLTALCTFLDIARPTWDDYCKKEDFSYVCAKVETMIRDQKFAGASAGLFNPMIIARDLGLRESTAVDHTSSDRSMTPQITAVTAAEAAQQYQDLMGDAEK